MFNRNKCKHQWTEISRRHTEPLVDVTSVKNASERTLRLIMFGITNVEMRCSVCGDQKSYSFTGE